MTLLETIVVVGQIGCLMLMLFPYGKGIQRKGSPRIKCAGNLKQIGLSFRVFANDHDDKFPFLVTNSLAFGNVTQAWLHFQAMSNECGSARILLCPADHERTANIMSDLLRLA